MNLHLLNPAGRLFEFMSSTWEAPGNAQVVSVWGTYLGAEPQSDAAAYFEGMAVLQRLPVAIRTLVGELARPTIPRSQLLRGVTQSEAVLELAMQARGMQVEQVKRVFHQGTLSDLETCSRVLNAEHGIVTDDEGDARASGPGDTAEGEAPLDAVRRLAQEIMSHVTEKSLPEEVSQVLWSYADAISRAVDQFKIVGPEGIRREFEGMVGAAIVSPGVREAMAKDKTLRERFAELARFVVLLGAAVVVPADVIEKGHAAYQALLPLFGQ